MAENIFQKSPFSVDDQFTDTPTSPVASRGLAPSRSDVIRRAKELDVDPDLALSFFTQESSGNWNSKDSPKGARGGFQVMPGTYRSMMGTDAGQRDPWNNMEAGLRYISYGQKKLGTRDPELLAAGYHAGYDRSDLKRGIIPNTTDGMISTRDYARSVASRLGKAGRPRSVDDEFSDTPPLADQFADTPPELPAPKAVSIEDKPYFDRLTEETKSGFGDMTRSLGTARWALGGEDDATLAEELAKSFAEEQPKTEARKSIDAAYQDVTDAQGVLDTTKAGAKALYTSITNPKETSLEIARNAANALPTIAAGAAGAGAGAAIGGGAGALAGGIGAVPGALAGATIGGRAGMAVGTAATELGAEVQDMVQKRLVEKNLPPTAQNILAIVSDKEFKDSALKQGLAKGLTVAAVDQVFLGLGGKIATAPVRRIASQELAAQGMDMATSAGRKAAFASPAGQAALKAAAPSVAARAGAGAAAVGVDAAGESIGEGLSQKVARGEVDYGDALREGVVGLGQSVVETAAGATIESAKQAASLARGTNRPAPKASGPLGRAAETAATEAPRVTVTAQDGQVSGEVTGQSGNAVEVTGDDGQVYHFKTGPGGVQITPEAPNAPLSNALDGVAAEQPSPAAQEAAPVAPEPTPVAEPAAEPAPVVEPAPKPTAPADMTDEQLTARLDYLKGQAKEVGWNRKLLDERRKVENEQAKRQPQQTTLDLSDQFTDIPPTSRDSRQVAEPVAESATTGDSGPAPSQPIIGFTTAKGSTYTVNGQSTARNKAARSDPGHEGDSGQKEPSTRTIYVDENAAALSAAGLNNVQSPRVVIKDGKARLTSMVKGKRGADSGWVAFHTEPAVGRYPLELWKPKDDVPGYEAYSRMHAGNPITELQYAETADKVSSEKPAAEPTTTYQQRNADRLARVKQAKTQAKFDAITAEEHSDAERDFTGTDGLRMAINDRKFALKSEAAAAEENASYDAGEWVTVAETGSRSEAEQEAAQMQAKDKANEYRVGIGQNDGWTVKKRKKDAAEKVSQPAPTGGTSEAGAGTTQPTQAAPGKPKTASKEDLEHLFGIDKKRAKALERIAAGRAWFNDGVKAKNFITENGLKDTHEAVKGKGGRWDIVAKPIETQVQDFIEGKRNTPPEVPAAPKVTAQQAAQKAAEQAFADGGTETNANRAATTALIEKMADNPDISISNEAPVAVAAAKKAQEASNVTNERASGQPTGSEEMVGGQETAQAAPVQPDAAAKEVSRKAEGRRAFAEGKDRSAPQSLPPNGRKNWLSGWDEANAEAPVAQQRTSEFSRNGITITVAKIKGANEYGISYASTNIASAATKADADAIAQRVLDSGADNIGAMREAAKPQVGEALPNATAPEQVQGVDDRELGQIVKEFNTSQTGMIEDGEKITHVFDLPKKSEIVRLNDKVKVYVNSKGWMTPDQAKAEIAKWKEHAQAQFENDQTRSENSKKVVLSLFDLSGEWSKPWEEAGYQVYRFDIQADPDMGNVNNFSTEFFSDWFGDFDGQDIYAILAACPCTDFAVSGARHFAAKDADGRTVASVKLVHQTLAAIEYFKPAVWAVENPVGRIEALGGLPPWRMSFDPNHLGDPYTKKTLLWGRFNGDLPIAPVEPTEGSKMHRMYGGKSMATKNARSVTPEGFSYGFFMANNAADHPAMAIANKYDRLDRNLIEQAVAAGVTEEQISEAVDDAYYMDLDDAAANQAIRDLIKDRPASNTAQEVEAKGGIAKQVRDMDADGRAKDGKPIKGGDFFRTLSGRTTTPYPSQKSEKYASNWLIENATSEARELGDEFNARSFGATTLMKDGSLAPADRDLMLMYLFEQQPEVAPSILKPLAPESANTQSQEQPETGKIPEQQSKQPELAPGTRINGDVERAAADRLEELYKQMALITNRNSREGNAKAAVRGVVEELRRPRTVTSVQAILEKASSDLAKNYGAFSDVIDEVAETLGGAVSEPSKIPEPAWWTEQNPNERYHRLRASGITRGTARTPWNRLTAQEQRDLNDQWGEKTSLFAENKLFTADAVEKARAVLRSKLNQLNTGVDPEIVMAGMTIAGAYIEAGVRSFGDYAKAMTDDLGPKIKPFLLSFYEAARNYPGLDTEGMTPVAEAKAAFDALNAEPDNQTGADNEGKDNGSQKLDQPGSGELAGEQPEAVQGTEQDGQARRSPEGRSGTDVPGSERSGRSRVQPAGRMGDDAGEVSSLASRRAAGRGKRGGEAVPGVGQPSNQDIANAERGHQLDLIPTDGTRAQDRSDDFIITDEDAIGEGGQKTKFKQNVAAIRLLKDLQAENRQATRDEQKVLAKYVGWGGIPQAFYRDNGEVSKGWEKEAAELKDLLTPEEMAAAASSTRNAHYTSPEIVAGVWDAAKHFGFQGGRVLEPSVGVGNFFGLMPSALRSASQLTGVELDHITGGLAKQLYPQANIAAPVGFQDFSAPDNYFDLAIGNPPFGREGIYDANRRKISGFSIHNYFFAKSIDTVKPNGVLAMVVTNRLLDSVGDKARQYIADRAEFLGAIRLPNNAFAKNAGTEVTTDIIFLRKLKEGEQASGNAWMDVKQITDKNGKTVPLNEYFIRNPDMMLGEFGAFGSMYSPDDAALVAREGQDTPALLREAIAKLPRGFMDAPTAEPTRETIEPMHDISHVKVGSVFEQGGQIYERKEDMLNKQQAVPVTFPNEKAKERVSGMIKVRDALVAVRRLQLTDGVNEKALEDARAGLNAAYDTFVKTNGPLNSDANKRLMRDDPTWPQIAALEDNFDKGISAAVAKTTGEKARPASAKKSAIFFKRTQSPYKPPEKSNSAKDALVASLSERGRVDLDYMASLYGKTPEAIADELDGIIFEAAPDEYVTREEYLSGNVKKRLAQTIELAERMPRFKKNVEALRAVQPADIEAVDIDVKTGAHWVPTDVMQAFIEQITEGQNAKAVYNPINATWTLSADRIPPSAVTQWGTDRTTVMKVLEAAANQKQITIYDEHSDGSRTLNEKATTAANEKVERVKAEWKNWLWSDDARRERLARIYNDTFNTDVQRDYDGSHLTFPGKVGNDIIQLRPHQANAVWRMVQSGTTLLDHVVGAGKTFTVIAGVMEMRRMGLAKKPMLVVPNHLVGQWAEDFMKLYPGANILAATKKDFEKDNRKRLFARIATGDWDAVIVAHSSFGKVEVEPEFQEAFIRQQISDMDTSIAAMRDAEGKKSRNVKQIEKQKAALEEKLKKLFDTGAKDDNLYFSELGVDGIFLDEAHEFKNLGFSTGMQRVAGLGNPTGSGKASDMFMKVQAVLRRTNGRNVVFATGTPISNTMAEMYTMQRYLDYPTLKAQGISHFDAWAKTFGEVVTDWELSPSGQYKMNSRFAKFVNMPELMQRYQSFADVINRDDINRQLAEQGKKLPVPKVATGKPENIVVPRSTDQADYIGQPITYDDGREIYPEGSLIWRSENLPKKAEKGADNMLKIMSDARKAALDMRLINPNYPEDQNSKVNVAADNIKTIYDQWAQDKGTQLVFIDLSTPKGAVAKEAAALRELIKLAEEGDEAAQDKLDAMSPDELLALESTFSVYDDLKAKLISLGIPEKEIAFIHDANTELQKEDLFGKVRSGRVRVLFGSTAKMGAGMNVQERLVALHHLDAPWRPSDLEQREGRIIRQGNKLYEVNPEGFEVRIMRYATKQTLDSRMWQTIEAKARFIEQVRKGASDTREIEDVAGEAANSAEMKAASSGNPLILEEMTLRKQIRTLENSQSEHNREQYRVKDRMRMLEAQAERFDREAAVMEADAPNVPKEFAVTIGNQTFDKHGEAGEAILAAVMKLLNDKEDSRDIGTYGGFDLSLEKIGRAGTSYDMLLVLKGAGEYQIDAKPGSAATGLALRLQNTVKGLAAEAERARSQAASNRRDIPKLEAQIKPWGQEQELADAKARHASVIDQLRPKAKEQKPKEEEPAASRSGVEAIFAALEQPNKRNRMLNVLSSMPEGERIAYIDQNFLDILEELDDKSLVAIKC